MYELIYNSQAAKNISDKSISEILEISRNNNQKMNITGLLVFDGARFFQILEGERSAVNHIYSQIKNDERHQEVDLYHTGHIERRSFSDWSMSYKLLDERSPVSGWMKWLDAQNIIRSVTSADTLGCRILKLTYNI